MNGYIVLLFFFITLFLPAHFARALDTTPPDPVADLRVATSTDSTLMLVWTAPGDDGMSGTVSHYDLRMGVLPINPDEALASTIVGGEPQPVPGGEQQTMTVTQLTPSTTYWFIVRSQDRVGNIARFSNVASGTTALDTSAPQLERIKVIDISATAATVTWKTDEPSTSEVRYGTTPEYGLFAQSNGRVIDHMLPLGGLTPDVLYHYRLRSVDQHGNTAESVNMTFQTSATGTPPSLVLLQDKGRDKEEKKGEKKELITAPPPAIIQFTPAAINLKASGKWMTAVVRFPKSGREGMDFNSLLLNGKVKPAMDFNRTASQAVLMKYGSLWLKFPRAEVMKLVPPEVTAFMLTLTGRAGVKEFSASQSVKIMNNITREEAVRREEERKQKFEKDKLARIRITEKAIEELKKKLEDLINKLEKIQAEAYSP